MEPNNDVVWVIRNGKAKGWVPKEELDALRKELAEERDPSMWRYWSAKAAEVAEKNAALADRVSAAESKLLEAEAALQELIATYKQTLTRQENHNDR